MQPNPAFQTPEVAQTFLGFPEAERSCLLKIREMVFDVAARTTGVGRIEETLKWGQPAYLTPETKSGTTLRLGVPKTGGAAVFVHCQTRIVSEFQSQFPEDFTFDGTRAVHIQPLAKLPKDKLETLIARTLTYHLKRSR